jgi:hypothetical protein
MVIIAMRPLGIFLAADRVTHEAGAMIINPEGRMQTRAVLLADMIGCEHNHARHLRITSWFWPI